MKNFIFLLPLLLFLTFCKQRSSFERDLGEESRREFEALEIGQEFTASINPKMGMKVLTTPLYTFPCRDTTILTEIDDLKKAYITTTNCTLLEGTWYAAYADYNGVPIPVLLQMDCKESGFIVIPVKRDGVEVVIPVQTTIPANSYENSNK